MGYKVIRPQDDIWKDLTTSEGHARSAADITTPGELVHSRARVWRYGPGAAGKPHAHENGQEEVYVVLEGRPTILLGDELDERVELEPQSLVVVHPGTNRQVRNESGADAVIFIYGAPPPTPE